MRQLVAGRGDRRDVGTRRAHRPRHGRGPGRPGRPRDGVVSAPAGVGPVRHRAAGDCADRHGTHDHGRAHHHTADHHTADHHTAGDHAEHHHADGEHTFSSGPDPARQYATAGVGVGVKRSDILALPWVSRHHITTCGFLDTRRLRVRRADELAPRRRPRSCLRPRRSARRRSGDRSHPARCRRASHTSRRPDGRRHRRGGRSRRRNSGDPACGDWRGRAAGRRVRPSPQSRADRSVGWSTICPARCCLRSSRSGSSRRP